jgi:dTDP-4-dehydrorhamnose reductase
MNIVCLGRGLVGREFERSGVTTLGREVIDIRDDFNFYSNVVSNSELWGKLNEADVIINCIAFTNTKPKTASEFRANLDTNVHLVRDLTEFCDQRGKKLVHISTGDIYGDSQRLRRSKAFKETDSTIVMTEYSAAKYLAEQFIDIEKHIILRPRLVFGSDDLPSNLITKLVKYSIFTPYINSFCSARTIAEAAQALINNQVTGVFNICNTGVTSMLDLAEAIRDNFDSGKKINPAEIDSINNVMDCQKLLLHYKPRFIMDEFLSTYRQFLQTTKV